MSEKKITAKMLNDLRPELNATLVDVAKKYGLTIEVGNASFDSLSATFQLRVSFAKTEDFDPDKAEWDANCMLIGMKPEDFGKEVTINQEKFTICGFNKNARTNKVLIRSSNGKVYTTSARDAKNGIADYAGMETPALTQPDDKKKWAMYCRMWGLNADDFGKVITIDGSSYEIVGCNPKARKNVILVKKLSSGKTFCTDAESARDALRELTQH